MPGAQYISESGICLDQDAVRMWTSDILYHSSNKWKLLFYSRLFKNYADKEEETESRVPDDEVESYAQMFSRQ